MRAWAHFIPVGLIFVAVLAWTGGVQLEPAPLLEAQVRRAEPVRSESTVRTEDTRIDPDPAMAAVPIEQDDSDDPAPAEQELAAPEATVLAASREPLPIFYEHTVQAGETVSGIAEVYGVTTDSIVWNNVDVLADANALPTGAILQIPSVEGIIHSVRVGETVSGIAEVYDAEIEDIVDFQANGFHGDANNLPEGALILVPGGRRVPVAAETPGIGSGASEGPVIAPTPPPWVATFATPVPAPVWTWPATGRITNTFGPAHPLGIDISMVVSTPLVAAMSGTVVFVGGNPCCSYGYHVIIDHGDGYETLYAHMSEFAVANGQWVNAGDVIGYSGNTGYSTGPHLHFEVRKDGNHLDPFGYLP